MSDTGSRYHVLHALAKLERSVGKTTAPLTGGITGMIAMSATAATKPDADAMLLLGSGLVAGALGYVAGRWRTNRAAKRYIQQAEAILDRNPDLAAIVSDYNARIDALRLEHDILEGLDADARRREDLTERIQALEYERFTEMINVDPHNS